jgi:hypothetical protein
MSRLQLLHSGPHHSPTITLPVQIRNGRLSSSDASNPGMRLALFSVATQRSVAMYLNDSDLTVFAVWLPTTRVRG